MEIHSLRNTQWYIFMQLEYCKRDLWNATYEFQIKNTREKTRAALHKHYLRLSVTNWRMDAQQIYCFYTFAHWPNFGFTLLYSTFEKFLHYNVFFIWENYTLSRSCLSFFRMYTGQFCFTNCSQHFSTTNGMCTKIRTNILALCMYWLDVFGSHSSLLCHTHEIRCIQSCRSSMEKNKYQLWFCACKRNARLNIYQKHFSLLSVYYFLFFPCSTRVCVYVCFFSDGFSLSFSLSVFLFLCPLQRTVLCVFIFEYGSEVDKLMIETFSVCAVLIYQSKCGVWKDGIFHCFGRINIDKPKFSFQFISFRISLSSLFSSRFPCAPYGIRDQELQLSKPTKMSYLFQHSNISFSTLVCFVLFYSILLHHKQQLYGEFRCNHWT